MVRVDRETFTQKWEQKRFKKVSKAELLRSEAQALKTHKSEFKKLRKGDVPVSLTSIYENLDETVRKITITQFLDKWVRENICKRLEIEGDTWYYFDVDIPE